MRFLFLISILTAVQGLQNLIPKQFQGGSINPASFGGSNAKNLEQQLLQTLDKVDRLENSEKIDFLVGQLEQTPSIVQPAISDQVYGRWRLVHTTNADTASPIQKKAVSSSKFPIYQDIVFNENNQLVVSQVVQFSDSAELKVDALASTAKYPLAELTERKGDGKILGIPILGVSKIGEEAQEDPNRPDSRITFVFDEGNFDFGGTKIPYPVPFRLPILRDAVKGYIDITYLSPTMRISRGNKGTTFILVKE